MKRPKFKIAAHRDLWFHWLPKLTTSKLRWKDKFDSPRCEREPYFEFSWLWFCVYGQWGDDQYWEQWLWIHKYHDGDEKKAKAEWGWVDMDTEESTWIDYE